LRRDLGLPDGCTLLRGEQELVREYCKLDVVSTLLVLLSWLVQRGDLEPAGLRKHVATIQGDAAPPLSSSSATRRKTASPERAAT